MRGERLRGERPYGPQHPVSTGSSWGELRGHGTEPNRDTMPGGTGTGWI